MHPTWGNTKNGTTGIPVRIMTGHGTERPEDGTSRQKQDRWQPYTQYDRYFGRSFVTFNGHYCVLATFGIQNGGYHDNTGNDTSNVTHAICYHFVCVKECLYIKIIQQSYSSNFLAQLTCIAFCVWIVSNKHIPGILKWHCLSHLCQKPTHYTVTHQIMFPCT